MKQASLFPNEPQGHEQLRQPRSTSGRRQRANGARDAVSRYSRLKEALDQDFVTNGNWTEVDSSCSPRGTSDLTFADLFSGAGGISVGASSAGLQKVFSVEIDNDASQTIRNNFPTSIHYQLPIEDLDTERLLMDLDGTAVNVIFGGPPCQGFSVAGLRNPKDPRNRLFTEFVRIVDAVRPEFVVLENVPGILTMEDGRVKDEIIRQFEAIGYPNMSVRILEAAAYGVPQLRTRAIFIANRLGVPNPYPRAMLNPADYVPIERAIEDLKKIPRNGALNHEWTRHSRRLEARISAVPPGGSLYDTFRDAYKRQHRGVPSMTVKENHGGCHIHYELDRVLSAREMARLQTFPDDFAFSGTFKRAYWQIGNAVPCLLAQHIASAIRIALE